MCILLELHTTIPLSFGPMPNRLQRFSNLFLAPRYSTKSLSLKQSQTNHDAKTSRNLGLCSRRPCVQRRSVVRKSRRFSRKDGSPLLQGRLLRRGQRNLATPSKTSLRVHHQTVTYFITSYLESYRIRSSYRWEIRRDGVNNG